MKKILFYIFSIAYPVSSTKPPKSPRGGFFKLFIHFFVPLWGVWGAAFKTLLVSAVLIR